MNTFSKWKNAKDPKSSARSGSENRIKCVCLNSACGEQFFYQILADEVCLIFGNFARNVLNFVFCKQINVGVPSDGPSIFLRQLDYCQNIVKNLLVWLINVLNSCRADLNRTETCFLDCD